MEQKKMRHFLIKISIFLYNFLIIYYVRLEKIYMMIDLLKTIFRELFNIVKLRNIFETLLVSMFIILVLITNHLASVDAENDSNQNQKMEQQSTIFGYFYYFCRSIATLIIKTKRSILNQKQTEIPCEIGKEIVEINENQIKILEENNASIDILNNTSDSFNFTLFDGNNTKESDSLANSINGISSNVSSDNSTITNTITYNTTINKSTNEIIIDSPDIIENKSSMEINQNDFINETINQQNNNENNTNYFDNDLTEVDNENDIDLVKIFPDPEDIIPATYGVEKSSPTPSLISSYSEQNNESNDSLNTNIDTSQENHSQFPQENFSNIPESVQSNLTSVEEKDLDNASKSQNIPTLTVTPTPPPQISIQYQPPILEEAEPINAEKINRQLDDIRSKLKIHKQETLETLQSISQNFENVLYERESEVEIYLKYIYDDNGRNEISYGPKKFNVMYEGVSLPKGSNGMWEAKGGSAEFVFFSPSVSLINKIAFDLLQNDQCTVRNFYFKVGLNNEPEIASSQYTLKQSYNRRQNFTLPYAIRFNTISIKALNNYGNTSHVCLPEFRVFQRVGFHS